MSSAAAARAAHIKVMTITFDPAKHPRAGQTGQAAGNPGQFAVAPKTEAPDGMLEKVMRADRRREFIASVEEKHAEIEKQIDKALLADFCDEINSNYPKAVTAVLTMDEEGDEIVWVDLFDEDDNPVTDNADTAGTFHESATEIFATYGLSFDRMARVSGQRVNILELAMWEPEA